MYSATRSRHSSRRSSGSPSSRPRAESRLRCIATQASTVVAQTMTTSVALVVTSQSPVATTPWSANTGTRRSTTSARNSAWVPGRTVSTSFTNSDPRMPRSAISAVVGDPGTPAQTRS